MTEELDDLDLDLSDDDNATPTKKSKLPLFAGIGGLILALAGGGGFFLMSGGDTKESVPVKKVEKPKPKLNTLYVHLKPTFEVSIRDMNGGGHILQVGVSVMTKDKDTFDVIEKNQTKLVSDLLVLFSSQKFNELLDSDGKIKLRQQAEEIISKSVTEFYKQGKVEGVLFTKFIME